MNNSSTSANGSQYESKGAPPSGNSTLNASSGGNRGYNGPAAESSSSGSASNLNNSSGVDDKAGFDVNGTDGHDEREKFEK